MEIRLVTRNGRLRPVRHFLLLALVLMPVAGALAERCAVCGEEIKGDTVYTYTDEVTKEKKHVCYDCSILPDTCFVCGMPLKGDYVKLPDGRTLCARDAKSCVLDPKEAEKVCEEVQDELDRLFSRFTAFPTNIDVAVVDRVNLQAFRVPGNDYECPDILGYFQTKTNHHHVRYDISLMSALPRTELKATCAHELSHAWVAQNVSAARKESLDQDAEEGFCELVAYLLMDSENENAQKKAILQNNYTRGQVELFIAAENTYSFNDVLDWMKWGTDDELDAEEPRRIHDIDMPHPKPAPVKMAAYVSKPPPAPDTLVLKGISGTKGNALAMINDQLLAVGESARIRVGKTNVLVRCLAIRDDSVLIQVGDSEKPRELSLKTRR